MAISIRSGRAGTVFTLALFMTCAFGTIVKAETVKTVNGVDIDSAIVDMYLESRIQKPAEQASAEERNAVMQELTDIYLLTTQPGAKEFAKDPALKAQIELQSRALLAQAVASDFFSKNPATDAEILAEYEDQVKLAPAQQFKARDILVECLVG